MIVTIVNVYVKKEHLNDFISATKENHEGSVKEPGNLRFDVLQSQDDPTKFVLYEAYESKEAALRHKDTPHYQKWRSTVSNWMEKPREGVEYKVICPERSGW